MAMKGILWSIVFFLTAVILILIPSYLIFEYWILLNKVVDVEGRPLYTYAFFAVFLYIISLLVAVIYLVAGGVKGFGLVVDAFIIFLFIIWYLLFNEIAIFSLKSPYK